MSGFQCTDSNALGLFGIDVHILGYDCNDQGGVFGLVMFATLIIKLLQNKLWAAQAQRQRELLQMEKEERLVGFWYSPLAWMLCLEFLSTVIGIISVLVIMGANIYIFMVIIVSNLLGTGWTYAHMEKDHHSTSKDILNLCNLIDTVEEEKDKFSQLPAHMQCKYQQAVLAIIELQRQLNRTDLDQKLNTKQSNNAQLAFSF